MCRISNPTEEDFVKLRRFAETHCTYLICGQIETVSYVKTIFEWVKGDPTTPHCHFYFEVQKRQRWTAFQKKDVLGKGYRFENARTAQPDCEAYCLKGEPAVITHGTPGTCDVALTRSQVDPICTEKAREAKKSKLTMALAACPNMKTFIREHPDLFAKNCHGVREIFLQRIRDTDMVKPVSEWHFGHTRSGKTYAGLDSIGGMDNPDCHYQQGNLDWMKGNYMGESILFLNEYRHSGMEAFTNLLTILEGYRAEMPMKGSFVPIRAARVIITCPRPP